MNHVVYISTKFAKVSAIHYVCLSCMCISDTLDSDYTTMHNHHIYHVYLHNEYYVGLYQSKHTNVYDMGS